MQVSKIRILDGEELRNRLTIRGEASRTIKESNHAGRLCLDLVRHEVKGYQQCQSEEVHFGNSFVLKLKSLVE